MIGIGVSDWPRISREDGRLGRRDSLLREHYHLRLVPPMQRFEKQRLAHLLGVVVLQEIARLFAKAAFPEKTHGSSLLIKKRKRAAA